MDWFLYDNDLRLERINFLAEYFVIAFQKIGKSEKNVHITIFTDGRVGGEIYLNFIKIFPLHSCENSSRFLPLFYFFLLLLRLN